MKKRNVKISVLLCLMVFSTLLLFMATPTVACDKSEKSESVPECVIDAGEMKKGIPAYIIFEKAGLCKTRSEARRLISQGGGYMNNRKLEAFDQIVDSGDIEEGSVLLRAGKKRYVKVIMK